jgi:hypothetical protein
MLSMMVAALLLVQVKPTSWGGTLHGGALDGSPATMELAVATDGAMAGRITGPKIQPGTVRGTHDAKTGAVRFDVAIEGSTDQFSFTGTILKDTLKASTTTPEGRVFMMRLVKGVKAPELPTSSGPQNPADPARAAVQRTFTEVSGWVARAAAMVPPERYSYRPTQTVRTFGDLVGHVADAYTYYCTRAGGRDVEWSDAIEKGTKDKAALAAKLKTAQDLCVAAQARGQLGALVDNVAHTNLHYGNIITYMRMMGLTPPSS